MGQEWYEYAISIKKRINNKISNFMIYFILIIFSLPLLKHNIWYWLILTILYCLSLFYNSQEKDDYAKVLLDIGIMLIVIGLEIASMVSIYGADELPLVICTIIGFVLYEILVFVKVKRKAYSTCTAMKIKKRKWFASSGVLIGSILGCVLIRKDRLSLLFFLLSFFSVMLFIVAISFLQRYVVYKIINNSSPKKH